jgi:hypothetical protein
MASQLTQISQLVAVRCGEIHPPMLARAISTPRVGSCFRCRKPSPLPR